MASLPWKLHIEDKAKLKNKKVLSRILITKMTLILVGTKPWLFLINIKIATIGIHLRKPGLIKSNIIIDGSDTGNGLFSIRAPWLIIQSFAKKKKKEIIANFISLCSMPCNQNSLSSCILEVSLIALTWWSFELRLFSFWAFNFYDLDLENGFYSKPFSDTLHQQDLSFLADQNEFC